MYDDVFDEQSTVRKVVKIEYLKIFCSTDFKKGLELAECIFIHKRRNSNTGVECFSVNEEKILFLLKDKNKIEFKTLVLET